MFAGYFAESGLSLVDRFRLAPVIDSGDGYGENVAVYFWDSCLRVLPATGDGKGEDGMLEV